MKLAFLSDIHANLHALQACLEHAQGAGAQGYMVLGDLVGYGADPGPVLDCVRQLAEDGAVVLRGNHDALALAPPQEPRSIGDSTAQWTHDQLSIGQLLWLDTLPLTRTHGNMLLVHASAQDPEQWRYVYNTRSAGASLDAAEQVHPEVRYVFGGHVHEQTLYFRGADAALLKFRPQPDVPIPVPMRRQWLVTVGSVGQPRDGDARAMYALLDTAHARLVFHRVPYDIQGAAQAIRRAGLPAFFAERLERGR